MKRRNRVVSLIAFVAISFSCSNSVTVELTEYEQAFRNPMKGWREFFAPGSDIKRPEYPYPFGSMIKEYMQWNNMERVESDGVDKVIAYSNHRWAGVEDINVKVIPRAYIVWVEPWHGYPGKDPNNPDDMNGQHWPDDIPPEVSPYKNVPGEWTCYIEAKDSLVQISGGYFDPSFPARVEKFVEKLGEAWDNDPRVAYVEMGIIGEWGEHHDPDISTFWPPHDEPDHLAGRTWVPGIEKTLGDAFTKAFKNKKVMVRYAYEFQDYEFGIYWDSWAIDEEIDRGYNAMLSLGDRWKTQPIGGEITWGWGSLKLKGLKGLRACLADDATRTLSLEQIRNLHCNHLGGVTWSNFQDKEFYDNASVLQKAMGYRYVLDKAEYPAKIKNGKSWNLRFSLTNTGSSPFYYQWPVEVLLLDAKTHEPIWKDILKDVDIREWMPGENYDVATDRYMTPAPRYTISEKLCTEGVPEGEYVLALAVLDPAGMLPSLRFANNEYFEGGYTVLGRIGVGSKTSNESLDSSEYFDVQSDKTLKYVVNN